MVPLLRTRLAWARDEKRGVRNGADRQHGRRAAELVRKHDPRIRWADGTDQGESIDILKALDERYPSEPPLFDEHSAALIGAFKRIFPRMTRPSSRAAFLFRSSGQPVARRDFEATLEKTDALLGERGGPFFAGKSPTAPDVCWAPFLERYAAQLPLLHDGLRRATRRDTTRYGTTRWSLRRCGNQISDAPWTTSTH